MRDYTKYSESNALVCYKKGDNGCEISMLFNKETKTVDITVMIFHNTGEPTMEPMDEWEKHSADKGHWQMEITCMGMDDIEFLHRKSLELFGQENLRFWRLYEKTEGSKNISEQLHESDDCS